MELVDLIKAMFQFFTGHFFRLPKAGCPAFVAIYYNQEIDFLAHEIAIHLETIFIGSLKSPLARKLHLEISTFERPLVLPRFGDSLIVRLAALGLDGLLDDGFGIGIISGPNRSQAHDRGRQDQRRESHWRNLVRDQPEGWLNRELKTDRSN